MDKNEALWMALGVLEFYYDLYKEKVDANVINAIKAALAQPEQEPVAWVGLDLDNMAEAFHRVIEEHHSRKYPFHHPVNRDAMLALREFRGLIAYMKRNTTPPRREWVGLTVKEIEWCFYDANDARIVAARSIEAKLKQKNGFAEEKNGG